MPELLACGESSVLSSRNVTAQSHLDLKVWSCHTLRNELLGTASVNLSNVLKNNGGKSMYDEGGAMRLLCGAAEEPGKEGVGLAPGGEPR